MGKSINDHFREESFSTLSIFIVSRVYIYSGADRDRVVSVMDHSNTSRLSSLHYLCSYIYFQHSTTILRFHVRK